MKEQINKSVFKSPRYYSSSGEEQWEGDLRRARKEGWFPSVTTVLGVWPKYALVAWQIEQALLASLTLPKKEGEPLEKYAERIVTDMDAERDAAAEWGSEFHKRIEAFKDGVSSDAFESALWLPVTVEMDKAVRSFAKWVEDNVKVWCDSELVVVNSEYGYAGRTDFRYVNKEGRVILADIKTRNNKGKKPVFYPEQIMQLSAYEAASSELGINQLQSIIVDRETGEITTKEYTSDEAWTGWLRFKHCLALWCVSHAKPYYPSESVKLVAADD